MFDIIVAADSTHGIGLNQALPWRLKTDLKNFKQLTSEGYKTTNKKGEEVLDPFKNVLIMGRLTWESLPGILPNRVHIVLTSQDMSHESELVHFCNTLDDALQMYPSSNMFVIGGSRVMEEAFEHNQFRFLYLTKVNGDFGCDTFLPQNMVQKMDQLYTVIEHPEAEENDITYQFCQYQMPNQEEQEYLRLMERAMIEGDVRQTRNAITHSIFAPSLTFDLSKSFPSLTSKKMFWKGIVCELLFFIKGQTNSKILEEQGVKIWMGNTSREFLDSRNLEHYEEGDMGPMYGFQWRHYGAEYHGMNHDYTGQGTDQLINCLDLIKNDPYSRRIMMTTFNPGQLPESVLAPCHSLMIQFYVQNGQLSCHMYQRSSDIFLGLPFNISSTALLTHIMARLTNLNPGKMTISLGDAHLYQEHLNAAQEQLQNCPYPFCQLQIDENIRTLEDVENSHWKDYKLVGYKSHGRISAPMVA